MEKKVVDKKRKNITKKKKSKQEKKEVCETYELEDKKGNEKIIKTCGEEIIKHGDKKEKQTYNKIIRNVLIGIVLVFLFIAGIYFIVQARAHFEYKGIKFELVKEGELLLYQTKIPVVYNNAPAEFNLYLRKDPRKTINIPFNGELSLYKSIRLNSTQDLNCEGKGVIGVANMAQYYQIMGAKMIKDENATCEDAKGQYTFIMIQSANKTSIEEVGESCYNINVKDCEILDATERFILEGLIKTNKEETEGL